ncbi:MAG: hypothetical protein J0H31_26125 [Alphaproteobacteria bacterium]|nr:hypothetical protein [Alphaproteobacteria bacterium]
MNSGLVAGNSHLRLPHNGAAVARDGIQAGCSAAGSLAELATKNVDFPAKNAEMALDTPARQPLAR